MLITGVASCMDSVFFSHTFLVNPAHHLHQTHGNRSGGFGRGGKAQWIGQLGCVWCERLSELSWSRRWRRAASSRYDLLLALLGVERGGLLWCHHGEECGGLVLQPLNTLGITHLRIVVGYYVWKNWLA